jgi:hypothetical protein
VLETLLQCYDLCQREISLRLGSPAPVECQVKPRIAFVMGLYFLRPAHGNAPRAGSDDGHSLSCAPVARHKLYIVKDWIEFHQIESLV